MVGLHRHICTSLSHAFGSKPRILGRLRLILSGSSRPHPPVSNGSRFCFSNSFPILFPHLDQQSQSPLLDYATNIRSVSMAKRRPQSAPHPRQRCTPLTVTGGQLRFLCVSPFHLLPDRHQELLIALLRVLCQSGNESLYELQNSVSASQIALSTIGRLT